MSEIKTKNGTNCKPIPKKSIETLTKYGLMDDIIGGYYTAGKFFTCWNKDGECVCVLAYKDKIWEIKSVRNIYKRKMILKGIKNDTDN